MKVLVSVVLLAVVVVAEPPRYRQFQQQRQYYFARQQEEAAPYAASGWRPAGPAFNLPQRQSQQQNAAPSAPQQQYGAPSEPQQQYGAPSEPQQQYGAPSAPQQQYGAPSAPQQQYGASSAPQQQYGAPSAPQQQYGASSAPQQQYGAPSAPQQQYGAPSEPQQQYGAPSAPQQQYGAPPTVPQRKYGVPEESTTTEAPNTTEEEEVSTVQGLTGSESEPVNAANELENEDAESEKQPQQSGEYYVALPDGRLQRVQYISRQNVEAMKYFAKIRAENVEPLRGPIYAYAPLQKLQIVPASLQLSVAPVAPVAAVAAPAENKPQKLELEPVAAQVQYQYDNAAGVVPLTNPLSTSYTTYTANYQAAPAAPASDRFLLTFQ